MTGSPKAPYPLGVSLRALSLSLSLALIVVSPLFAGRASAQQAGTLVLEGDFEGAEVFVDAEPVGTMPLEPLSLASGNHTIRVTRPGFTEYTGVFRIRPRQETSVSVEMMAISMALSITTEPAGAQIFLDGSFAGESPLELELNEGEHSLRLKSFGFHEAIRTVNAVAGQDDSLAVTLEALPADEVAALTQPPPAEWYEEPLTWVAIGGGALAVAAIVVIIVIATQPQELQADAFCNMAQMGRCIRLDAFNSN